MTKWLKLLLGMIIVSSCGVGKSVIITKGPLNADASSLKIIKDARTFIGTPYVYAGTNSKGMDCSGLSHKVFDMSSIVLPRTTSGQARVGKKIAQRDASPGDLIFFIKGGRVFHVGIISKIRRGEIWMIHASSSKGVVEQEILSNSYWRPKLHQIRQVI